MKWFKSVASFVRDVCAFIRERNREMKTYEPILEELEVIQILSKELHNAIDKFSQRLDLFPESQERFNRYRQYVLQSERIYARTRVDIVNSLLAMKNKNTIGANNEINPSVRRLNGLEEQQQPQGENLL